MATQRRDFQRAYLELLARPPTPEPALPAPAEGYPLDFCTLTETLLPHFKGVAVPRAELPKAREWIDELLDRRILVRDLSRDRAAGDFFILAPKADGGGSSDALARFARLPRPAAELPHPWKQAGSALLVCAALLFFVFYSRFMPQAWTTPVLGTLGFLGAILGVFGLSPKASVPTPRWSWATLALTLVLTLTLGWLDWIGFRHPFRLHAQPGASVAVDGKFRLTVPRRSVGTDEDAAVIAQNNPEPTQEVPLLLSWEDHEITVGKQWFVNVVGERAETIHAKPFENGFLRWESWTNLRHVVAFQLAAAPDPAKAPAGPPAPPVEEIYRQRVETLFRSLNEEFGYTREHPKIVQLTVEGQLRKDAAGRVFLDLAGYNPTFSATIQFPTLPVSDPWGDAWAEATAKFCRGVLGALNLPEASAEGWSTRFHDALAKSAESGGAEEKKLAAAPSPAEAPPAPSVPVGPPVNPRFAERNQKMALAPGPTLGPAFRVVYLEITSERQRAGARRVLAALRSDVRYRALGIENIAGKARVPKATEIRYFHAEDRDQAEALQKFLGAPGIGLKNVNLSLEPVSGEDALRALEIWFGPGDLLD